MLKTVRYLLLQIRNPDDPMIWQEPPCFARALQCDVEQIKTFDMLNGSPTQAERDAADVVLVGGSGHYSAAGEGQWLERALGAFRELYQESKPTFASCWGFQAMARAMGGEVVHDLANAELGTNAISLTPAGQDDPIFAPLGETFNAQMGHEDRVSRLPEDAILLASSSKVENQAYRFAGKPIYCTQFHPELSRKNLIERIQAYPMYVEKIAGIPFDAFKARCHDTPKAEALLPRFVRHVLG